MTSFRPSDSTNVGDVRNVVGRIEVKCDTVRYVHLYGAHRSPVVLVGGGNRYCQMPKQTRQSDYFICHRCPCPFWQVSPSSLTEKTRKDLGTSIATIFEHFENDPCRHLRALDAL